MIQTLQNGIMDVNTYIVSNDKELIVIDPGEQVDLISEIIDNSQLTFIGILITHGHFDHIAGIDPLVERYNVPVYTSARNKIIIHNSELNLSDMMTSPFVPEAPLTTTTPHMSLGSFEIDVIDASGHTFGDEAFYIKSENALFTGDALFKGCVGRHDFPTSCLGFLKKTIRRIRDLPFDADIYPGHGEKTTLSYEREHNYYIKNVDWNGY